MLKDRILVAEQSMACNISLWSSLGLDELSERPPSINWVIKSSPSTYMIVPTLLSLCQASTHFIIYVLEGGG